MKVSVIIPAHNEEKHIAKTLKAVCALDYPNFEVIVIDNASTDKTSKIAKTFPVKVIYEKRKGTLFARERGRLEAEGEIIAGIDADCLPEPDWLKIGISFFKNPKIVSVSGVVDFWDSPTFVRKFLIFGQKYIIVANNEIMQFLKVGGNLFGANNFIRASALEKIGGFDTRILFHGDDTNTAKRLSKVGKIIFTNKIILKTSYRRWEDKGFFSTLLIYLFHYFKQISKND
ncbi:MAG: glycosyltransferase family 2 protein [Candidatus Paceibacterota bacterium]|jgi:glycosyltransferase involved in cell wall biosynthesis